MAARLDNRVSFAGGEVGRDFLHQTDEKEHFVSCKRMLNAYPNTAGRAKRRPGSQHLLTAAGQHRIFMYRTETSHETLVFTNGQVVIHDDAGAVLQTLNSAPWVTADLDLMAITSSEGFVYVASQAFWTQELKREADGTWSFADLTFDVGSGDVVRQPYFRFGARGVTLTPSGFSGSVTVTFSDDVLEAGHVGVKFRYATRIELEITAVTNATTGTATVTGTIFPNVDVTVDDGSKFEVGEIVQGEILQAQGIVTGISTNTLSIQMLDSFDTFEVITETGVDKDKVIGPNGSAEVTALLSNSAPSGISLWDEQMFSDVRGYPGEARIHKGRLMLARFPQATDVLAASAVNRATDFGVRPDEIAAADPFITRLGDSSAQSIKHLVSTEQLIVATNTRLYYVPESGENPLTPESVAFNLIQPLQASDVPPIVTGMGVMMIEANPERLMLVVPTGNVRASWRALDVSYRADHLIKNPKRLALANGFSGREQLVMILNGDGTLCAASPRPGDQLPGFCEWERKEGSWIDIAAEDSTTLLAISDSGDHWVSTLTDDARIDDEINYTAAQPLRAEYEQQIVKSKAVIATAELDDAGENTEWPAAAGQTVGRDFVVEITPSPPRRVQVLDRQQRIERVICDVVAGNYRIDDVLQSSSQGGDDLSLPTPDRARIDEQNLLGWEDEPFVTIGQRVGDGSELVLNSIRMVVES